MNTMINAENINNCIQRLQQKGVGVVRKPSVYSWGNYDECRALFERIFKSVDLSIKNFVFLPEYEEIVKWMVNTQGKGLLLRGNCGRGKSIILTRVIPVLLSMKTGILLRAVHSEELGCSCDRTWCSKDDREPAINLNYLLNSRFPIIDEVGIEPLIISYGQKYDGFIRIINDAEQRLKPIFVSTNLTNEELLQRYDERTIERLIHLCKVVEFEGPSLRE